MNQRKMNLSIITINYNGSQDTIKLLDSLKNQENKNFNILVIDNASDSENVAILDEYINQNRQHFSAIELIKNKLNLGFSGGNNVGIQKALLNGAEWVLLLNNDAWLEKDFFVRLMPELNSTTQDICGIPLIEGASTAYCGKIEWLKPTLHHVYEPISKLNQKSIYAIGGAVAIHKRVFEKIGLMDEKYFLYFEDADFSKQATNAGFKITILQNIKAHHTVSSSTHKLGSPLLLKYHYRNALYFNLKNGPWYIKIAVWPWSWLIIAKQIFKLLVGRHTTQSRAILSGVLDFYLHRFGKISLGMK